MHIQQFSLPVLSRIDDGKAQSTPQSLTEPTADPFSCSHHRAAPSSLTSPSNATWATLFTPLQCAVEQLNHALPLPEQAVLNRLEQQFSDVFPSLAGSVKLGQLAVSTPYHHKTQPLTDLFWLSAAQRLPSSLTRHGEIVPLRGKQQDVIKTLNSAEAKSRLMKMLANWHPEEAIAAMHIALDRFWQQPAGFSQGLPVASWLEKILCNQLSLELQQRIQDGSLSEIGQTLLREVVEYRAAARGWFILYADPDDNIPAYIITEHLPKKQAGYAILWRPGQALQTFDDLRAIPQLAQPHAALLTLKDDPFKHRVAAIREWQQVQVRQAVEDGVEALAEGASLRRFIRDLNNSDDLRDWLDFTAIADANSELQARIRLDTWLHQREQHERPGVRMAWLAAVQRLKTCRLEATTTNWPETQSVEKIERFAAERLKTVAKQRYNASIDPDGIQLNLPQLIQEAASPVGGYTYNGERTRLEPDWRSLTEWSLENIGWLRAWNQFSKVRGTSLTADQLTALVREADIGTHYTRQIRHLLADSAEGKHIQDRFQRLTLAQMRVEALTASINGDFLPASAKGVNWVQAVLDHPDPTTRSTINRHQVQVHALKIGEHLVPGAFTFSDTDPAHPQHVVVYLPGAPDGRLFRESTHAANLFRQMLRQPAMKMYFYQRVGIRGKQTLETAFPFRGPAKINLHRELISSDFIQTHWQQVVTQALEDVAKVATTTQQADKASTQHLLKVTSSALFSLVVPFMPAAVAIPVTLIRVGIHTSLGIKSWHAGNKEQAAWDFIDALAALTDGVAAGQHGRWQQRRRKAFGDPALRPYRIPALDKRGLHLLEQHVWQSAGGEQFIKLDGHFYKSALRNGRREIYATFNREDTIPVLLRHGEWQPGRRGRLVGGGPAQSLPRLSETEAVALNNRFGVPVESRAAFQQQIERPHFFNSAYSGSSSRELFFKRQQLLLASAEAALSQPQRPARPAVPDFQANRPKSFIKSVYRQGQGLVLGERHDAIASKRFLLENFATMKKAGVKTFYMEHLQTDLHQADLDAFMRTGHMPKGLKRFLRSLDKGHHTDPGKKYTFEKVVIRARQHGLRIVPADVATGYYLNGLQTDLPAPRQKMFNYYASSQINQGGEGKWVALMGDSHASQFSQVPGVAELTGATSLRISDGPKGSTRRLAADGGHYYPYDSLNCDFPGGAWVQADYHLQLPGAQRPATSAQRLTQPGMFMIENHANGEPVLSHATRSGSIEQETIQRDSRGVFIQHPAFVRHRFADVPALVVALERSGMKYAD
ncbi:membrane-targeted effector domain-containing toxin [Candidatus Pantoea multigeneris]|uniref:Dermonecrotic toxin N-terminal domain-containing protein n=1 Tax=Candidatus Pantoea multigeneris TaxID=2608357 RepID=A0ABX0REY7_9GAMM|nr:membrane-targeted effector domain-containing toxin [Pantoea multigeneris]NIF21790.1 hypothetical protein [Pantoea multigeneris]